MLPLALLYGGASMGQRPWPRALAPPRPYLVDAKDFPRLWPIWVVVAVVMLMGVIAPPPKRVTQRERLERIEQLLVDIRNELRDR